MNSPRASATEWSAIGTTIRVAVTAPENLFAARQIMVAELQALDLACSRFRSDSEIARLTANAGNWTPISGLLTDVLECALAIADDTDGDVDHFGANQDYSIKQFQLRAQLDF